MKLSILLILFFPIQFIGQTIEFIDLTDFTPKKELNNELYTLGSDSLIGQMTYVAKVLGRGSSLKQLYWNMHNESTDKGVNIYKLIDFSEDSITHEFVCSWQLYYAEDNVLEMNFHKINTNTVFVFGNEEKLSTFKVNGLKVELGQRAYYSEDLKEGRTLKVNKGGLTGMTYFLDWRPDGANRYLGLGGGSLMPGAMNNSVGISFTTGSLELLDSEFGAFLSQIYQNLND